MLNNVQINPVIDFQNISTESLSNRSNIPQIVLKKDLFERNQTISFQCKLMPMPKLIKTVPFETAFGNNCPAEEETIDLIKNLLEKNKGIIIGDCDYLPYTKNFLARNIKQLRKMNVKYLFLDFENCKNTQGMIIQAQENGMQVFGIKLPTKSSKIQPWTERIKKFREELGNDEKFIIFCKSDRISNNAPGYSKDAGIESVLKMPAIATYSESPNDEITLTQVFKNKDVYNLLYKQDSCYC